MAQPSISSYFNTRKRHAADGLAKSKAKVRLLEREQSQVVYKDGEDKQTLQDMIDLIKTDKIHSAVRNIQFDSGNSDKLSANKSARVIAKPRMTTRSKKTTIEEGQDIRKTFEKMKETKNVLFEKKGALSPKKSNIPKNIITTPTKNADKTSFSESLTPKKKNFINEFNKDNLTLDEIKKKISTSSRLAELRDRIDKIKKIEKKIESFDTQEPHLKMKKFEKIELEIPTSPKKLCKSPLKTPTKNSMISFASPERRLLFEPKEKTPSPVKCSPTKVPAYQRFQSLIDSGTPTLALPYKYRFLAEVFRCVDTVSAMLFNRKEVITFQKLKPAVQELLRKNLTVDHLAQIKTIYPNSYNFTQEKIKSFGYGSKEEFELVLTPIVEEKSTKVGSTTLTSLTPGILLDRKRRFYNALLDKTKSEHEKFLLTLEKPIIISKDKITRWHPEFDVENCSDIIKSELPQPPSPEKAISAEDVLQKAKSLFNCNTRMEKALQRLADAKMKSESNGNNLSVPIELNDKNKEKIDCSFIVTPPGTPKTSESTNQVANPALKGIPKALLEKVRAKQAAKALEAMTRTVNEDKEATIYSRLPEMAKVLRNIFIVEKKNVLTLEFVIEKLDNSYRTKLTTDELEEHIRLICKLLPTWASICQVRQTDYLKLVKDYDIAKVVKRLEIMANGKIKI